MYALVDAAQAVPGSVWDYEAWRAAHLASFVRMCERFRDSEFPDAASGERACN